MNVLERGPGQPPIEITPEKEELHGWNAAALLLAQASALFFIALCVYLIWHRASWSTWGFFLYGMWFNSGQYFVWYANLPPRGLVTFDIFQAFAQALGLTGFLAFAMFFPDEQTPGWRSSRRIALLAAVFGVLLVSGLLNFCNFFFGWRTEAAYRVYYAFTLVVYLLAFWFFVRNFRRLPELRSRMRWIVAGGLIGLPCFPLADIYEATGLLRALAPKMDDWIHANDWVLNLMYAGNVFLPAAVVYTALHHEVMSVRFALTRAVVLSAIFFACIVALHLPSSWLEETMKEHAALAPLALPISLLVACVLALIHNPLHGIVERLFAPGWHRAKVKLEAMAQRLVDDEALTAQDVDRAIVEDTAGYCRGASYRMRRAALPRAGQCLRDPTNAALAPACAHVPLRPPMGLCDGARTGAARRSRRRAERPRARRPGSRQWPPARPPDGAVWAPHQSRADRSRRGDDHPLRLACCGARLHAPRLRDAHALPQAEGQRRRPAPSQSAPWPMTKTAPSAPFSCIAAHARRIGSSIVVPVSPAKVPVLAAALPGARLIPVSGALLDEAAFAPGVLGVVPAPVALFVHIAMARRGHDLDPLGRRRDLDVELDDARLRRGGRREQQTREGARQHC
jgi:hypothetical protein